MSMIAMIVNLFLTLIWVAAATYLALNGHWFFAMLFGLAALIDQYRPSDKPDLVVPPSTTEDR